MNFKKFQFAGISQAPVLAEKGEVYKSPDGQIQQVTQEAPSHDSQQQINSFGIKSTAKGNGGVVIDAESVLSDSFSQVSSGSRKNSMKEQIVKIKPNEGEMIASQLGIDIRLKKSVSPSKLFLEIQESKDKLAFKILRASDKARDTKESNNSLEANKAQLMALPTDEEIYEAIFSSQEEKKEESGIDFEEGEEQRETAQYGKDNSQDDLGLIYNLGHTLTPERKKLIKRNVENEYARTFGQQYFSMRPAKIKNENLLYGLDYMGGNPTINEKSTKQLEEMGMRRSSFVRGENAMYVDDNNSYLPELAHAYQFNSPNPNMFGKWDEKPYDNAKDYDKNEYSRQGGIEYQAHKEIDDYFDDVVFDEKKGLEKYKALLNSDNNRNKILRELYHPAQDVNKAEYAEIELEKERKLSESLGVGKLLITPEREQSFRNDIKTNNQTLEVKGKKRQYGGNPLMKYL